MRVYSNSFICKNNKNNNSNNSNNNNAEIIKLKEIEKKYNELKKEKNKTDENNMRNDIIHLKEIKSIKEKYEKEIKELKRDITSLNNQINIISTNNTSYQNSNNHIKKIISDITEHFNKNMISTQKKYENKLYNMKQKIKKIKNILIKYINNNNNKEKEEDRNIVMINGLKEEISKIEKGKQKLEVQLSNYDIHFKKQKNEIIKLKNELMETNKKLDKLKNENRWNENDKSDLDDMNKKLKKQLEMYIIENNGKSKVIEERNDEISKLKELLNRKQ
jgi:exonuclease SbcC